MPGKGVFVALLDLEFVQPFLQRVFDRGAFAGAGAALRLREIGIAGSAFFENAAQRIDCADNGLAFVYAAFAVVQQSAGSGCFLEEGKRKPE